MKVFLSLILWLQVCWSLRDRQATDNYYRRQIKRNGNEDVIERPCSLHDVNCIRRYFAANSKCSPTHGPVPDPYKIKTLTKYMPHTNITLTVNDIAINGFNDWKINEFYINKNTDKLVLEVEFKRLIEYSADTVIEYFRKGKEPLEITDWAVIEIKSLSLTMTIPHIRQLDLSKAKVFTYISDAAPGYRMGSKFTESRESLVREINRRFLKYVGLNYQEAFVTEGPVLMAVFVQSNICDFDWQHVRHKW